MVRYPDKLGGVNVNTPVDVVKLNALVPLAAVVTLSLTVPV